MKIRLLLLALAAPFASTLHAGLIPQPVPDSGATIGSLVVGLALVVALRRKLVK
jgi:hypothetical protein